MLREFQLCLCTTCGTAFTWPRLNVQEIEKYYLHSYYGPENVKFITPMEKMVEWITYNRAKWISRQIPPQSRILEIGCGRGLLLSALQQMGHACIGLERSQLAATRAREIPGLQVFTQPIPECGFEDDSFDLIILWHVLEHLHDPAGILRQVYRTLKPGGKLIFEVPNLESLQSLLTGKCWFHLDVEHHLFHFSRRGLESLCTTVGFRPQLDGTFSIEQGPFGALQSVLNVILPYPETLYKILKKETPFSLWQKGIQLGGAIIVLAPSLLELALETLLGRGSVLRIIAIKPSK
jgi:SAM-dependent methyltransferase